MKFRSFLGCSFAVAVSLFVITTRAHAFAVVNLSATDSNFLASANGQLLQTGDLIEVGEFSISDSAIGAMNLNGVIAPFEYTTLLSDFIPLNGTSSGVVGQGTSDAMSGTNGYAGAFQFAVTGSNPAFAAGSIYLMVFNAATSTAATQVGVFKCGTFPANMSTGASVVDLDIGQVPPLIGTYTVNSSVDSAFNDDETEGNQYPAINTFNLDIFIPEPSTYALIGTGVLGLLATFRRRRSKQVME